MEMSFCILRNKEVVNVCNGENLGNITDIVFDCNCGKILGIILPAQKGFLHIFKNDNDMFIPYNRICKIGKDIILVDIIMQENYNCKTQCAEHNKNININNQSQNINIQSFLNDIDLNKRK